MSDQESKNQIIYQIFREKTHSLSKVKKLEKHNKNKMNNLINSS